MMKKPNNFEGTIPSCILDCLFHHELQINHQTLKPYVPVMRILRSLLFSAAFVAVLCSQVTHAKKVRIPAQHSDEDYGIRGAWTGH
jgi:hypothetical protein